MMPDPMNHARADEASSAIYIDFEGFTDQAPALIGILKDNVFTQVVLDDRLKSAAEAKDLRVDTGSNVLSELLSQAEKEGSQSRDRVDQRGTRASKRSCHQGRRR